MVRLRVLEISEEQKHTKHWLFKRLEMTYTAKPSINLAQYLVVPLVISFRKLKIRINKQRLLTPHQPLFIYL